MILPIIVAVDYDTEEFYERTRSDNRRDGERKRWSSYTNRRRKMYTKT